jgi:hypothetical protein
MARGRKSSWHMVLSPEEHQTLDRWQWSTTIAAGLAHRMEPACASVQLVHHIRGQGGGPGTCPGRLIFGYSCATSYT